jgi:hypothetical protein
VANQGDPKLADKGTWKLTAQLPGVTIYTPQLGLANIPIVTYRIHSDGPTGVYVKGLVSPNTIKVEAVLQAGCSIDIECWGTTLTIETMVIGAIASGTFELVRVESVTGTIPGNS